MYEKFIIFTVVLAFMALQLVQAKDFTHQAKHSSVNNVTQCYSCDTPSSCLWPLKLTCNQKNSNATNIALAKYFHNVVNTTSRQFECLSTRYTHKNKTVINIQGCVNVGVNACSLRPKNHTFLSNKCKSCNKDLCNPAGTFSSSSAAIIIAAVMSFVLLKYGLF